MNTVILMKYYRKRSGKGYAEADPSLDVDGVDAAHKLAIMVNLAYGTPVPMGAILLRAFPHFDDRY